MSPSASPELVGKSPAPLPPAQLVLRLTVIGMVVGGITVAFLYAGGWLTPGSLTPALIIDRFETLNGHHAGFRRNHAKGVGISGCLESNGAGTVLSKAAVLLPGRVPVIGRFALAVGQSDVADAPHTVRSMALLYKLPDGEEWRTDMIGIPVFPVNSAQGFRELLLASAPDPATGKPDPGKMGAFLARHPETAKAFAVIHASAVSSGFADCSYNSLDAFRFIAATGTVLPVRWSMVPVQPLQPMNPALPGASGANQLFDAVIDDIHQHALQWRLIIIVGQPGDPTADATLPWPADRQRVDVGT